MANTTNFNWETPDDTDLVKDGAAAIRTLGNSIDTSLVDLKGGTTGQVLSKTSGTDMDFTWTTAASGSLTKIHSSTFSAVSSKSVTNCFSSTYENYKVIFIVNTGTSSASMKLRFSSSGTDNTSALYFTGSGGSRSDGSFAPIASGPTATSADVARIENNSTQFQMLCLDVINPQLAKRTSFTMVGAIQDGTSPVGIGGGGGFNDNTQFQGITFFPTAGTMTGSIAIYGYES
jgi:hypothetical protein